MAAGKGIGKPRGRSVSLTTYNGTDTSLSARHSCALCCFATSWSQKADQGVENEGDDGESSRIDSETKRERETEKERGGGGGGRERIRFVAYAGPVFRTLDASGALFVVRARVLCTRHWMRPVEQYADVWFCLATSRRDFVAAERTRRRATSDAMYIASDIRDACLTLYVNNALLSNRERGRKR